MKTLDEIAIEMQTDRASVFTRTYAKPHNYACHYDLELGHLRMSPVKMLEIGVGGGEGVRMWLDYFENPDAHVFGVDNNRDTNEWNTVGGVGARYKFVCGDQSDETFWNCFAVDYGSDWDFICDDGSHVAAHIITTFNKLWPMVKPGGFYAIEDLLACYGEVMDFIHCRIDQLNTRSGIDSIYFAKELCILRKAL